MPDVSFVLVEPLYEGNVGFAARAIKNFGFSRLVLVNPCPSETTRSPGLHTPPTS